jgi:hypothetical protein
MEFVLGYLIGVGANFETIVVTIGLIFIIAVVWKAVLGD